MSSENTPAAVTTPLEMMYHWESETPERIYLRQAKDLQWQEYSWGQVADTVRRVAAYIRSKGYPNGSRIAIWSSNSKDWVIADLAIMLSGHISVPIYPGQDIESASYILEHSESVMIFLGDYDVATTAEDTISSNVDRIAMLGCTNSCETSIEEISTQQEPYAESPVPNQDDIFTIIYTSGTTGNPKGVMHMHSTPGHVVPGLVSAMGMGEEENRLFSFLPMAHAAERIVIGMASLYCKRSISFSEGLETFAQELHSVQPTFFFAVPRLWIKFKQGVDAKVPPEHQRALNDEQRAGIVKQLGLSEARFILTGSAPCPHDVQQWFLDLGVVLRDGYGMTENFVHGVSWSKDDNPKLGCVGQPMAGEVEVRLSDQDEIQFRSKGLMLGYYKEPEKTAEVLKDGWYSTGDSGRIDEDGDLWVTGRISEVFKISKGKFVVPSKIENLLGAANELAQYCVIGHGMTSPILLTTLSEAGKALSESELKTRLEAVLVDVNSELNSWERLGQIVVTPEWTIENGLLTPTMKLKRKSIEALYRPDIESGKLADTVCVVEGALGA